MSQSGLRTGNAGLTSVEQMVTAAPGFRPLKVASIDRESSSVVSLVLEPVDNRPLTVPLPGQFVVLRLRPEADAPQVLRSYSLSGLPDAGRYRITIKQEPHGIVSTFVSTQLRAGDVLDISEPRGAFILQSGDRPVVLLSAGVGVTPVMAMLHSLEAHTSPRPGLVDIRSPHCGVEHPFAQEARDLLAKLPHARSHVAYSRPEASDRLGIDFDAAGRLTVAFLENLGVPREADFYVCGPSAFLNDFTAELSCLGRGSQLRAYGNFRLRSLHHAGSKRNAAPAAARTCRIARSRSKNLVSRAGLTVSWEPKFQSLLELAEACDVPVRFSCRSGVCHVCECGLISGSVNYNSNPLEPPAVGNLLICCSHPREDLVIDI